MSLRLIFHLHGPKETLERAFMLPLKPGGDDPDQLRTAICHFEHVYFSLVEPLPCANCNKRCKLDSEKPECMAPGPLLMQRVEAGTDEDGAVATARHEIYGLCEKEECRAKVVLMTTAAEREQFKAEEAKSGKPVLRMTQCHGCHRNASPDEPRFKVCAGCRSLRYCSLECQRKDWAEHKGLCKVVTSLRQ